MVHRLGRLTVFPPPTSADTEGLVAFGGDLTPARLIQAYRHGLFPWFSQPVPMWFSPDPRLILEPAEFLCSRSLRAVLRRGPFEIRMDSAFAEVIAGCATTPRPGQEGTWITSDMADAYGRLHARGYAHSVESWRDGVLVGGLYGIALGRCFFGESMFAREPNASKAAFAALVRLGQSRGWDFIDCQVPTDHLMSLGAKTIDRVAFLTRLAVGLSVPTDCRPWSPVPWDEAV